MLFKDRVVDNKTKNIHILQLNIGKKCNLECTHCHVMANAKRNEMMSQKVFLKALEVYKKFNFDTIDITGGEPTIHKDIEFFIKESAKISNKVILRSNLVGLSNRLDFIKLLANNNIELVASMPCYTRENVDSMRGFGTFDEIVKSIKVLNEFGYGDKLKLDLVYNPMGAFLPPSQNQLEKDYKVELEKLGLKFNNLLTITNIPIGCFKNQIDKSCELLEYKQLLEDNFNESTVDNLMCKYQVSVSYDGYIYDCDFNQMEDLKCNNYKSLDDILKLDTLSRDIVFEDYCYGCTAGAGSSCGGALNE